MNILSRSLVARRGRCTARSISHLTAAQREEIYGYTGGRWIYNEEQQRAARYVRFDIEELQRVACVAVGASRCVSFEKVDEGGVHCKDGPFHMTWQAGSYNKVFKLAFDNGEEAIARIPFPIAGAPFLTTASEVATMDFTRTALTLPVPRVLAWNAQAKENNPVGAEYIITEKMPGVPLASRWLKIAKGDVRPVLDCVFSLEYLLGGIAFSQIGSLYFKEDVSAELRKRPLFDPQMTGHPPDWARTAADKYRIGPIADRQWWRGERSSMRADRGPWPDTMSFLQAAAKLEHYWISRYAAMHVGSAHQKAPFYGIEEHLKLLDILQQVQQRVVIQSSSFTAPTLWHPKLNLGNILVAEEGPAQITGFTDWKHTTVAPYAMQATFPSIFTYDGPRAVLRPGNQVPVLKDPDHVSTLAPEEQMLHYIELKLAHRHKLYEALIQRDERRMASLEAIGREFSTLPHRFLRSWADSPIFVFEALWDLQTNWDDTATDGGPPPELLSDDQVQRYRSESAQYRTYKVAVETLDELIPCGVDGCVPHSLYERAQETVAEFKANWEEDELGGPFPYTDGGYSFFLN